MPIPLRPVKDLENNIPGILRPKDSDGYSPLQRLMLGFGEGTESQRVLRLQPINKVDIRDAEMLHRIWLSSTKPTKEDGVRQSSNNYNVPKNISDYDLIRLKTEGLIIGRGRNIEFTEKGDKIVKKKILEASSTFDVDRTREKYDPDQVMHRPNKSEK